jgi:hypothetical protein
VEINTRFFDVTISVFPSLHVTSVNRDLEWTYRCHSDVNLLFTYHCLAKFFLGAQASLNTLHEFTPNHIRLIQYHIGITFYFGKG